MAELNVSYPLNRVDNNFDVSLFVQEPARITQFITEQISANLDAQVIFSTVGTKGGSFLFNQNLPSEATADDEAGIVSPGGEFPVLGLNLSKTENKPVVKIGGKFFITDEAIKRNDANVFQAQSRIVANKLTKQINERGYEALRKALEDLGEKALTVESTGWASALNVSSGAKTKKSGENVVTDNLIDAISAIDEKELGYIADTIVLSSRDEANLKKLFGVENYKSVLASLGITQIVKSNKLPEGTVYVLNSGIVGVMGVETPISTENWREPFSQREWFQTWATLEFGITNPYAIAQITGVNN